MLCCVRLGGKGKGVSNLDVNRETRVVAFTALELVNA